VNAETRVKAKEKKEKKKRTTNAGIIITTTEMDYGFACLGCSNEWFVFAVSSQGCLPLTVPTGRE
jgi:hypothetical protein